LVSILPYLGNEYLEESCILYFGWSPASEFRRRRITKNKECDILNAAKVLNHELEESAA